jgi:hypothetical protein
MTHETVPSRGPMSFVVLLDEALGLARAHFRAIFPSVALPVAVLTTLVGVAQALSIPSLLGNPDPLALLKMIVPVVLAALLLTVLSTLATLAGQAAALDAVAGRPVDMSRAWRFAARPPVWGTLLLSFLAVLISFFCCILPVFFVAPLLWFVVPAMAEENRFGLAALSRSAELALFSPPRWPEEGFLPRALRSPLVKILLLLLVTSLISFVAGLLVALPFQIPMFIHSFRNSLSGQKDFAGAMSLGIWLQVPSQFLSALVRMAVFLYSAFGTALLFSDVRGRKEGIDLRPEIDALFPAPAVPAAGELGP